MENPIQSLIQAIASWIWGPPMLILIFGVGLYFTLRLKGLQFSKLLFAGKLTYSKRTASGEGNITPLQSLFGALGGLIGNGNLAGAATALFMGGPGALFWMWIGALVGMVIVYVETLLALMYREKSRDGTFCGGPMFYIQKVLKLKWLAITFAFAMGFKTLVATTTIQANSISLAASSAFDSSWIPTNIPVQLPYCLILALLTWVVIIGGIKSIARALEKITPFMVLLYLLLGTVIILANIGSLVKVFNLVLSHAFTPASAAGGFAGASVMMAIRYGVARGFYSNEAGTGSSPIMYSAAQTDNIYHQSLISMFGVFIDTVVASFTIVAILATGLLSSGHTSTALTTVAFKSLYGPFGGYSMVFCSFLFGYSTLIAWCFYGEQCFAYIWGPKIRKAFRWAFSIAILFGFMKVELLWSVGDLLNALTIVINLVALIFLISYVVAKKK